uniref:Acyl-CoA binding protein 4 n=1 Tax=Rhizophora mucronata TaxID=61149 RepID=A0A2P2M8A6_RHIMU
MTSLSWGSIMLPFSVEIVFASGKVFPFSIIGSTLETCYNKQTFEDCQEINTKEKVMKTVSIANRIYKVVLRSKIMKSYNKKKR